MTKPTTCTMMSEHLYETCSNKSSFRQVQKCNTTNFQNKNNRTLNWDDCNIDVVLFAVLREPC